MRPPGTASMRGGGIAPRAGQPQPQLMSRMGTGQAGEASENRPMTAVRAAGYTAAGGNRGVFDPANLGQAGLTLTLTLTLALALALTLTLTLTRHGPRQSLHAHRSLHAHATG